MNERFFVCEQDSCYVDAGYRWAFWMLEDKKIVKLGKEVDITSILTDKDYWNPPDNEKDDWLCNEILPKVKAFLTTYKKHKILYVDEEYIYEKEELFEWVQQ